jgi:serine/threonine protein kinase
MREVAIHAQLRHPCIIKTIGLSLPNSATADEVRIIMEYASNGSVADALSRVAKGNIPDFWTHENISCFIVGIVLGMKYLHSKNIIHRDLKPENLLIDSNFRLRICDFDSAIYEDYGTTKIVGTLAYMSPESFDDNHPKKKVDIFAFGLILFELLTGKSVFPKDATVTVIYKLHKRKTRPEIPDWISPSIVELIKSCWSVNPELRPTFEEIYDKLESNRFQFFNDVRYEVVSEYVRQMKLEEEQI